METEYYCFGDFEFTCGKNITRNTSEILSVGLVICDDNYKIVESFYCTARPAVYPKMTQQCIDLTHLSQQEIYNSPDSNAVMRIVCDLLDKYDCEDLFVWGNFDMIGLYSDAHMHGKRHMNSEYIRDVAESIYDIQRDLVEQLGLPEAVNIEELSGVFGFTPTDGTYHNALNDARGLYEIFRGAFTTDLSKNKKLQLLIQKRLDRIEKQRIKAAERRRNYALSISLFEEEREYIDSFPREERDEARNRFLDNRYIVVKAILHHPDFEDFVFVGFKPPKKPLAVIDEKYSEEKNPGSIFTSPFTKNNFAKMLVEYQRIADKEELEV